MLGTLIPLVILGIIIILCAGAIISLILNVGGFLKWLESRHPVVLSPHPRVSDTDTLVDESIITRDPRLEGYIRVVKNIIRHAPPRMIDIEPAKQFIGGAVENMLVFIKSADSPPSPFHTPLTEYFPAYDIFKIPHEFGGGGLPLEEFVPGDHQLYNDMNDVCGEFYTLTKSIPYGYPKRFEHTQIVGGSGAGKTTLLSHLILHDLHSPDPPCVILIDPKNLVIPKLSKLALFDPDTGPLKDRLIILSPEYKPSMNIFDNTGRSTAGAIDSLKYLCSALSTEFTTLQEGLAANLARLLLVFPQTLGVNATLADLRELMVDKFPEKFQKAVGGLRPVQQEFFKTGGFDNPEYRDAKRQIRRRLDQMIGSEHLESLFYSQRNAINIFDEMQKGSIILVDCAERLMDTREEASAFGCVFIAEVLRAIMQRNALPEDQRRPCFLFVDEAASFFRGDMNYFFEGARQCHVGGTFAFHYLTQKGIADLRDTMMAMTATKLLSGRSKDDGPAFTRHMGYHSPTEFSAFLDGLPPYYFALSIAGVQDKAVRITVPSDELDQEPPMSDPAYQRFLARNLARVSGGARQQPPPAAEPGATPPPPNEPPPRWTEQDDQALADAIAQQAIMMRRKNWKRVDELEEIIKEAKARKAASEAYYKDDDSEYRL